MFGSGGRDINLASEPSDLLRIFATDSGGDSACVIIGATKWSRVQQGRVESGISQSKFFCVVEPIDVLVFSMRAQSLFLDLVTMNRKTSFVCLRGRTPFALHPSALGIGGDDFA